MNPRTIKLTIYPSGRLVSADPGVSFLEAIGAAGADLALPCGGNGRCGKCKVLFKEGAPSPSPTEAASLTEEELARGYRLACQLTLTDDASVYLRDGVDMREDTILTTGASRNMALLPHITKKHVVVPPPSVEDLRSDIDRVLDSMGVEHRVVPDITLVKHIGRILRDAEFSVTGVFAGDRLVSLEAGDTTDSCFGVTFDIGTTTIAGYLLDLNAGRQTAVSAAVNPQTQVGDDVVSRINHTMQEPSGLEQLQSAVLAEINRLVFDLATKAEIPADRIYEAVIVGNTCMTHLALGIDPRHLATAPYVPTLSDSISLSSSDLGLEINPLGRVHVLPAIAGYVGADTVGAVLASALHEADGVYLVVDIGTNGEMVLGSKNRMLACSTAAGPAFEGAHIRHGMRAAPGAIDAVWLDDGDTCFSTVGDRKAAGICGSGLLDAIVCLFQAGIIESSGRIVDADEVPSQYEGLRSRLVNGEFVLASAEEAADGTPVVVTQRDVRELQLAKGAIAAGVRTLLDRLGIGPDGLDGIILAGAFGNYMRKQSAVVAGLIPDIPLEKVRSVGNAAGEGAKLASISVDARAQADRIAESIEYIELTTDFGFQERFADSLMFGTWSDTGVEWAINTT